MVFASCDTFVALPSATSDGSIFFAKNSDREMNEAQNLVFIPSTCHPSEPLENFHSKDVKCTYLSIPQVENTFAVLLSQPFWMWGAEMGVNEYGVCIGNEAIFTSRLHPFIKRNENVLLGRPPKL